MFHELFVIDPKDDDPAGEYIEEESTLKYYLPHIYDENALLDTISHEWLHALFQWADEENWNGDKDHYIMRNLGFN